MLTEIRTANNAKRPIFLLWITWATFTTWIGQKTTNHAFWDEELLKSQVTGPIWNSGGSATAVSTTIPHFAESQPERMHKNINWIVRCLMQVFQSQEEREGRRQSSFFRIWQTSSTWRYLASSRMSTRRQCHNNHSHVKANAGNKLEIS